MTSVSHNLFAVLSESSLPFSQEQLKEFYGAMSEKYFDENDGCWSKPYGTCTFANAAPFLSLTRKGHKVEVWGADEKSFARSGFIKLGLATGHDFGLVDDRWLIDVWANGYLGVDQVIYDLKNRTDGNTINALYPPRSEWVLVYSSTRGSEADKAQEEWHSEADNDWSDFSNSRR